MWLHYSMQVGTPAWDDAEHAVINKCALWIFVRTCLYVVSQPKIIIIYGGMHTYIISTQLEVNELVS